MVRRVGGTRLRVLPLSPNPPRQSPASEGEEEELLMEEDEEEVLAGVSAEDKSRRPPAAKGPSEPAHSGERPGQGEEAGRVASGQNSSWGGGWGHQWPCFSSAPPRCPADNPQPDFPAPSPDFLVPPPDF